MRTRYDLPVTRFICDRSKCKTVIDVPSDVLYDCGEIWCQACDCEASARLVGTPATDLPNKFQLPKQFDLLPVPRLEPSDDLQAANSLYRPYSQRSFLRQYDQLLKLRGLEDLCDFTPSASCFSKFDPESQRYTDEIDYELVDECNDGGSCQFLRTETIKPLSPADVHCSVLQALCSIGKPHSLCDTPDECQILQNYLLLTGGDHYAMAIPQPSLLLGRKRPDFLALCQSPDFNTNQSPCSLIALGNQKHKLRTKAASTRARDTS